MENLDKEKIEKIIKTGEQAHAFYSKKSEMYLSLDNGNLFFKKIRNKQENNDFNRSSQTN